MPPSTPELPASALVGADQAATTLLPLAASAFELRHRLLGPRGRRARLWRAALASRRRRSRLAAGRGPRPRGRRTGAARWCRRPAAPCRAATRRRRSRTPCRAPRARSRSPRQAADEIEQPRRRDRPAAEQVPVVAADALLELREHRRRHEVRRPVQDDADRAVSSCRNTSTTARANLGSESSGDATSSEPLRRLSAGGRRAEAGERPLPRSRRRISR